MTESTWNKCLRWLEDELPERDVNTWLRPLRGSNHGNWLELVAPNQVVVEQVRGQYWERITHVVSNVTQGHVRDVRIHVGGDDETPVRAGSNGASTAATPRSRAFQGSRLDKRYIFESFVQGKSNQIAKAAAEQVAANPGNAYNPLLVCGCTGLGKTHLMHAIGNRMREDASHNRILFLGAERFVNDFVNAVRHNRINDFKDFYRSINVLLIDDIQFFANKKQSQEEFFHTFNHLLEEGQQVVMTCDRYPRELDGIDERLRNRFAGGMSVFIEPPELETRAAILLRKAELESIDLGEDVAFFVAEKIRSNVRELEAALKTLKANLGLTGERITVDFAREALRHMLSSHDRVVTIENIQKKICEYFHLRREDLLSARRSRSIARPRQIAMSLAKELTERSYPEIGDAFGGRDHTTVLHACRKVRELRLSDARLEEDYVNLLRALSQ